MSKKLHELGELAIVESIRKKFPTSSQKIHRGIGDDAAVVAPTPGARILLTKDLLVEGVHFDLAFTSPPDLGWKALAVNLSDVAAMGGIPRYALLGLGLPARLSQGFLRGFYRGWARAARRYRTELIGGDTCAAPAIFISVTLMGESGPGGSITRAGARPGEGVFVSGCPGGSALGLLLLQAGKNRRQKNDRTWIRRHLTPEPRLALARELARKRLASSMIDLSDGIILDLRRLAKESQVGIEIDSGEIPLTPGFLAAARSVGREPLELALCGGEDYELAFTSPPEKWEELRKLAGRLRIGIKGIGRVRSRPGGVTVRAAEGKKLKISSAGYEHFREGR